MASDKWFEQQYTDMLQEARDGGYDIESFEAGVEKGMGMAGRYLHHAKENHAEGCDCMNCVIIRSLRETEL